MTTGFFKVPTPVNEPNLMYAPGSKERAELKAAIDDFYSKQIDIPMVINGERVKSGKTVEIRPPHKLDTVIGTYHKGNEEHVKMAIKAALDARESWAAMPWEQKSAIFLKAAELLAGPYRARMNAATMIGQSKNAFQAEIDSACEMIDFFRFNVKFATELFAIQPDSLPGIWNRMDYRPLEGFVLAISPFNFTSIAANLPTAPALMGNTVVWKPSNNQVYSAIVIMELMEEAGLPKGVLNLVYASGPVIGNICFSHPDFAGVHFTGSTAVFQQMWKQIGENMHIYKSYPRVVGETGGKDFVIAHSSADAKAVVTALSRGAFEYQGQKCSAASRAYIPSNLWEEVKSGLIADLNSMKIGPPEDFTNFINAVIDEKSFDKLARYIDHAKDAANVEIIAGGNYDKSKGYFIEPTVIVTQDPYYVTMCEELFGPVLTLFVYDAEQYEELLEIANQTSPYALTGAIFAQERDAVELANRKLVNAAGNFYINDKPTGAVVGQQPFGGARASGTNDKAGSIFNLIRWVNARSIKETLNPAKDYRYPFMIEK